MIYLYRNVFRIEMSRARCLRLGFTSFVCARARARVCVCVLSLLCLVACREARGSLPRVRAHRCMRASLRVIDTRVESRSWIARVRGTPGVRSIRKVLGSAGDSRSLRFAIKMPIMRE